MVIKSKLELSSIIADTKSKFLGIKTRTESFRCRYSDYIAGKFIFKLRDSFKSLKFEDILEIKTKGILYVIKK